MALITALAVVGSYICVTRVPDPIVDRMIREESARISLKWKETIVENLSNGPETFRQGSISSADIAFLELLLQGTDIYRYKLMSAGGTVFWASRPSDIGSVEDGPEFHEHVARGEVVAFSFLKPPAEVDGFRFESHSHHADVNVAEIYVPVVGDGGILGAIEFYTEVTHTHETYVDMIRTALLLVCGTGVLALLVVSVGIVRSGNRAVRDMRERSEQDRKMREEQVRLSREVRLLGELNEWLQSASSLEELFDMVSQFMAHLLPGTTGSLYVYSNSRDVLDGRTTWNDGSIRAHMLAEECWGLRRGRTYSFSPDNLHFACAHVDEDVERRHYGCIPILAHGETVGLMHLAALEATDEAEFSESRRLAQLCSEQISMAIANVQMRDQLLDQSIRDPLTGLYNRRHMMEHLRRFLDGAARKRTQLCVMSIDVDHFKNFNDTHGHDAGDMVLRAVGAALERNCDGDEIACRMGGEEFLLILPEIPASRALARAETVRRSIEEVRVRYGEKTLPRVTASIGLSVYPDHGLLPQELIRASDEALYEAKARGRNRIVLALSEEWEAEDASGTGTAAGGATASGAGSPPPLAAE